METPARPSRRRQYVEMMHHRAMHQVNECLNVCLLSPRSEDKWTCVARDKGGGASGRHRELYAKKSNTTQSVFFLGLNEVHCGFDEVYTLLNYQSTEQFRLVMQLLYGRNFRDGALLSSHAPRDYDDDYDVSDVQHSALWFTLQATRESLVGKDNSLAFFQALMVLHPDRSFATTGNNSETTNNNATFARPSENVQKRTLALAWLPFLRDDELELGHGTRQIDGQYQQESMRLKYTLIVEEVARARLKLSCVAMSFRDGDDLYQSRPSSAARTIAKRLVNRSVSRLEAAIVAARISRQSIVLPHQWVKNEDRVKCVICWKPFHSLIRRRHHCRLCGEVVCGSCCSLRSTHTLDETKKKLEKVRVCHMCSNRGGTPTPRHYRHQQLQQDPHQQPKYQYHRRRSNSFASQSNDHGTATLGGGDGTSSTMDSVVMVGGHDNAPPRVPILERGRGEEDHGEDDDDDKVHAYAVQRTSDSGAPGTGYFGYIGAIMGAAVSSSSSKLISLRSMTRAELVARSNSTASRASSTASSAQRGHHTRHRRSSPHSVVMPGPSIPSPPPRFIGRTTTPSRPTAPPPLPPPHFVTPFYGAMSYHRNHPPSPPSNGPFSLSFLHPSVSVPNAEDNLLGPMSIVADVGSHDRMSTVANAASHERSSFTAAYFPGSEASRPPPPPPPPQQLKPKTGESSSPARFDPLRRTSMMSIAMLDAFRTSESDAKAPVGSGTSSAPDAATATEPNSSEPKLDAVSESHRLKLMELICSPACTLVDRGLMRECCERAALDCGVRGAFLARVEANYVVLEHVVGTTNLSAIDHFLRADTPCDFVLATPSSERPFSISDCSTDKRTTGMIMVKDVGMRFFAGVSILVRGLPIACLCVFSEGEDDEEAVRLSRLSAPQYEFHVLEAAGQRISLELERLVHGMDIALD